MDYLVIEPSGAGGVICPMSALECLDCQCYGGVIYCVTYCIVKCTTHCGCYGTQGQLKA